MKAACLTLERVATATRIFLDSTIFIDHATGASPECRRLLERCEAGDVAGVTSVVVLAEVAHRLMMIEAVAGGLVSGKDVVKKLRAKPAVVGGAARLPGTGRTDSVDGRGRVAAGYRHTARIGPCSASAWSASEQLVGGRGRARGRHWASRVCRSRFRARERTHALSTERP